MRRLKCISRGFDEPTFKSAEEAIAYRSPRNEKLEKETQDLRGAVIVDGSWSDSEFRLELSNGKLLRLGLDRGRVIWTIGELQGRGGAANRDPVILDFSSKEDPDLSEVPWDREALLRARIGSKFLNLYAGNSILFLYTEGHLILMFSCLLSVETQSDLLYWSETD